MKSPFENDGQLTDTEYIELQTKSQGRWDKKPNFDALQAQQQRNPYSLDDRKKR